MLNKALKMKKKSDPDLFAPGDPCKCKCSDDCEKFPCEGCKQTRKDCKIHTKNEAYEILTTGMVGGPSIVFCRYAEAGVSQIRSHIYEDSKTLLLWTKNALRKGKSFSLRQRSWCETIGASKARRTNTECSKR